MKNSTIQISLAKKKTPKSYREFSQIINFLCQGEQITGQQIRSDRKKKKYFGGCWHWFNNNNNNITTH